MRVFLWWDVWEASDAKPERSEARAPMMDT